MKPVAIVTDSCCDLPPVLVDRLGITVVPLAYAIDGTTYRYGDISSSEVTDMHLVETGPVIATHCGTGWGVTVLPAE